MFRHIHHGADLPRSRGDESPVTGSTLIFSRRRNAIELFAQRRRATYSGPVRVSLTLSRRSTLIRTAFRCALTAKDRQRHMPAHLKLILFRSKGLAKYVSAAIRNISASTAVMMMEAVNERTRN